MLGALATHQGLRMYSSPNIPSSFHQYSPFLSKPAVLPWNRCQLSSQDTCISVVSDSCTRCFLFNTFCCFFFYHFLLLVCLSLCNGSTIISGKVPVVHHTSIKPSFPKEVITQIKQCKKKGGTVASTHLISLASTKHIHQIWWVLFVAFPLLTHNFN